MARSDTKTRSPAAFDLYPAIDLKDGACVRLLRGAMDAATTYNPDPADQAQRFVAAGCRWLHVVDLNGAIEGKAVNAAAVEAILAAATVPVQLGGGIRDMGGIEAWLARGVRRVVLGTVAVREPQLVIDACKRFPGRIAVGIDARGGMVAVQGWVEATDVSALTLARAFEDVGVAAIIYTDIDRDGALEGPNLAQTVTLAGAISTPVIASGGVAALGDLAALQRSAGAGIVGAIVGRALYDGRIDLAAALALLRDGGHAGGAAGHA
ncbi:MAG: 1-(5-phosphoribosyl)-5-[(5-phosphoribosylamino)methylideneamino]imidazole-4-carboxamide isomerase [Alphaproteobacteria bacterium]|nr:1-(5-phosphoribosyl)-5-[(5-phosphoribosylamino)methylideneamino]imidazole-4-carboxamide isomerase [Alphaproteobacteria bacterium]